MRKKTMGLLTAVLKELAVGGNIVISRWHHTERSVALQHWMEEVHARWTLFLRKLFMWISGSLLVPNVFSQCGLIALFGLIMQTWMNTKCWTPSLLPPSVLFYLFIYFFTLHFQSVFLPALLCSYPLNTLLFLSKQMLLPFLPYLPQLIACF